MFDSIGNFFCRIPVFFRLLGLIYVAVPAVIKFYPKIIKHFTFLNFLCPPKRVLKLHDPKGAWKLKGVTNFFLEKSHGVRLGIWHVSPLGPSDHQSLSDAEKVIVYCHGNAFHRAFRHRLHLYKLLQSLNFHVIAFDYRGFGDSRGSPTEDGVIEDAKDVYSWTVSQIQNPNCQVLVWGHSLGTTISTQMVYRVQQDHKMRQPDGLVLEAPFTTFLDMMFGYPLSKYLISLYPKWLLPKLIKNAAEKNCLSFDTAQYLPKIRSHILILHAKDDVKVPYKYGLKLFSSLRDRHECRSCKMISFESSHRLGHNECWSHSDFSRFVQEFSTGIQKAHLSGISDIEV